MSLPVTIDWERFAERAAIIEYDGGASRAEAEALAMAEQTRDAVGASSMPEAKRMLVL